ncbi:response regulator [Sulfoacidibacillus ferrooxidans]|uniref:Transcriptional regulatory protein DegU n=1 Tax=Sulfoacidibacillus ferrooxidans TaxID=2005001 RepID=A0A9X1V807_9BACL|nr:Transcriptional regulatory protein DegU [Sulfoacidibacillus ferrooxidans]
MGIRVAVVDDHHLFRKGVIGILQTSPDFDVIGEAENGREAVELVQSLQPDVLIMDLSMPQMNGFEATRRIRELHVPVKILILTVNEEEHALFDAIKHGAQGYMIKTADPDELLHAVHSVALGEAVVPSNLALKILSDLSRPKRQEIVGDAVEPLTAREIEVLRELGTGAPNKDIAKRLYISENTVRNHVRNILDKLHISNRVEAATYAVREGLTKNP